MNAMTKKKSRYPVGVHLRKYEAEGMTVKQGARAGALVGDNITVLAVREPNGDEVALELTGVDQQGEPQSPEELFNSWLLYAQAVAQLPGMPLHMRQQALQAIEHWQHVMRPIPVNAGYPS